MSKVRDSNSGNLDFAIYESAVTVVADPVTIAGIRADLSNNFIGIKYFADAGGATPATPGAGTVQLSTISVSSLSVNLGSAVAATGNVVTPAVGNLVSVTATPAAITTATHYKITISQNV